MRPSSTSAPRNSSNAAAGVFDPTSDCPFAPIPTPESYFWSPKGTLSDDAHQMAELYSAFARDLAEGTTVAPTFADASRLHRLLDTIAEASTTGERRTWKG